jgi:hypothetical protein
MPIADCCCKCFVLVPAAAFLLIASRCSLFACYSPLADR